jgi:DNA-binding response OmpR family regulator
VNPINTEKLIYIADDEANIRTAIKTFLESAGYIVEDFENGDLLMEAFAEKEADLVILDVMMPGSNGFVVCKELRKISRAPIIMLTARDSDLDYMTGLDLGGDDYLSKPFSPMALVVRIKSLFRRLDMDRETYEQESVTGQHSEDHSEEQSEEHSEEHSEESKTPEE